MITCIIKRSPAEILGILTESGHVISLSVLSGKVSSVDDVIFPPLSAREESIIPISLKETSSQILLVGYTDGTIKRSGTPEEVLYRDTSGSGISSIQEMRENILIATWKGSIFMVDGETGRLIERFKSPHVCQITKISMNSNQTRIAIASTDGRVSIWELD